MKTIIFYFIIFFYSTISTFGSENVQNSKEPFVDEKITNANYPTNLPTPKGKIVDGIRWTDKSGTNIIVISVYTKGEPLQKGFASEIYASQFFLKTGTYDTVWKIKDFNYTDSDVEYAPGTLKLIDIDNDGIAESSFFYTISNGDHQVTKSMLHTQGKKLAIRGYYTIFDSGEDPRQDSLVVDPAFKKVNSSFYTFAEKEWKRVTEE